MASPEILARLSEPVRRLVLAATRDAGSSVFGGSEKDAAEVKTWIEKTSEFDLAQAEWIKALDSHLLSRTFLVSNYLTAADVAVYGTLHSTISKESPEQYYSHPSVTRYFDHIQTRPAVRAAADSVTPPYSLVSIDVENAPKPVRIVAPSKKAPKAPVADAAAAPATTAKEESTATATVTAPGKKERKKEPKEKKAEAAAIDAGGKKGSGRGAPAPVANEPSVPIPSMIDLRVGHIVDVKKHPDADGLYVEQIDLGETTGPRTVVSGLVNYIPIEQMQDKWLVVVCNLKPANMRGVKSHAMVLCATHKDGKDAGIEIIDPPKNAKPGDRVYFEGQYENDTPLEQLNPKKKIFETIQPGFITLESKEAAWVDPATKSVHRLRTHAGPDGVCTAPSFIGASLS
ncbi:nucleic acid-binding protein [Hysterangium stoloniferum]|nr:nucleic acid-binding protein [Hysterangium stoloniferum]